MLFMDVVGFLQFLVTAANVVQAIGRQQLSTPVCTSDLCHQVAREIISKMDETVDPCVDFFAYACNRLNSSNGLWSEVLRLKISKQLEELFGSGKYTNRMEKKAVDIYNQCINETQDRGIDVHRLLRAIDDLFAGWSLLKNNPNVSAFRLNDVLLRLQQNNIQTIIYLSVERDDFSSDQNILFFRMPGRLYNRWELCAHYPNPCNATGQLMTIWKTIVQRLMKVTNASVQWSTVEKRLEKVLMLDFTLATIPNGTMDFLRRKTFGDLGRPPYRSRFLASFLTLFNNMLNASSVNFRATAATQFGAPLSEYLIKLDQTMAQLERDGDVGLATLADWLWWIALNHYYLVYQEAYHCVKLVKTAMPLTVSRMFFRTYVPNEVVQKAKELTSEIVNGVRDAVLLKTTWMDMGTKETAMDRLNHTLRNVGYPEEFLNNWTLIDGLYAKVQVGKSLYETLRNIDQSSSWINLQKLARSNARSDPFCPADLTEVFAKFYSDINYIVIPESLLQPPILYPSNLDIFNYARFGYIIGHEFTHVLDIGVKEFDTEGGKPFYWWTNATQNNYHARKYTLVDFYNNISTKNDSIDARQTLIENTADNGGYRAAYLAFQDFMRRTGYRIKLPGLEALNESQLFWLIGAQAWCTSPLLKNYDEKHGPNRFHVMGPYMNSEDFGADYRCPLGTPMNPRMKAW
ncbi:endothelin-converting enzyme 1-like isoform X2 [Paramacrobiotus metropolitanus]|uniref:endothelin-converting enzyme 1-like isoform X2 n=1 Tax=Paramacrobiotus metropolitanus TaxID=2943436 RepID=UPI002445C13D|nr:endothelin-converting enzyme 1-like isoform X2 [Paramacrobiotus metropolitanus]